MLHRRAIALPLAGVHQEPIALLPIVIVIATAVVIVEEAKAEVVVREVVGLHQLVQEVEESSCLP